MIRPYSAIAGGENRTFTIAGIRVGLRCKLDSRSSLRLPASYQPFSTQTQSIDVELQIGSRAGLDASGGSVLYDSQRQWRVLEAPGQTIFEFRHPPTSLLYCRAVVEQAFSRAEILFSEAAWRELAPPRSQCLELELPYPLEQLLLVPALAMRGAVLLHACGAVLSNRSLVFAGHSGDGKTTLSGLLAAEGMSLLSDERVAIGTSSRGFVAFGTPWPGEGEVVSNAGHPLRGLFLLRKASSHALGRASCSLAPELLARAIVPYYLPHVAERILDVFSNLARDVPVRELHFARTAGLASLLREVA